MIILIPYYVDFLLIYKLYLDIGQCFVSQLLVNQRVFFLLKNKSGFQFRFFSIVNSITKCIYPFIFHILYMINLKEIGGQYLGLSNLLLVQLFYTNLIQQVLIVYIDLNKILRPFQIYSLFTQSFYYYKKFLIMNIVVQLRFYHFISIKDYSLYLIIIPLLDKAYTNSIV